MASRTLWLMHFRRLLTIAAAGGLITGSGVALAGGGQQPPVFRSSVDLVTADVTVLERLLRSPRPAWELPLRVGAYAFQDDTAGGLKLLVSGERITPAWAAR